MNEKKISFILCVNQEQYSRECVHYIENLYFPDGFEYDIFRLSSAPSMAAGYQAAMAASDAKYKVYLHQDVFLIHKGMILEMIQIFQIEPLIGMLGIVGSLKLPKTGVMWEGERCGVLYSDQIMQTVLFDQKKERKLYTLVDAVDGLLIMTQYDLPWREDLFGGWDFYDVSQSMEFKKAGYQIAVPNAEKPWCLHDKDLVDLREYEKWRQVFLKEYEKEINS